MLLLPLLRNVVAGKPNLERTFPANQPLSDVDVLCGSTKVFPDAHDDPWYQTLGMKDAAESELPRRNSIAIVVASCTKSLWTSHARGHPATVSSSMSPLFTSGDGTIYGLLSLQARGSTLASTKVSCLVCFMRGVHLTALAARPALGPWEMDITSVLPIMGGRSVELWSLLPPPLGFVGETVCRSMLSRKSWKQANKRAPKCWRYVRWAYEHGRRVLVIGYILRKHV